MSKLFPSLRAALPAAAVALSLVAGANLSSAQSSGVSLQVPEPIGATRALTIAPYDFSGRVFDLGAAVGFGSGTLLHRQTVLTAGHVVYDPVAGFTTSTTFTRGLYENTSIQKVQVSAVEVLAGYQSVVDTEGNTSADAFQLDQGLLLLADPPVDENWADFSYDPTLLTNPAYGTFVLGYPGVTFDGRTLAYIVPMSPFVPSGTSPTTGSYENDNYAAEEGMSGGGIFVAIGVGNQQLAGTTVGGIPDTTGEFNAAFIRVIDKTSRRFIDDAEFASGLIRRARVTGPAVVQRGTTVTYNVVPVFLAPSLYQTNKYKTLRYDNIKLKSDVPPIQGAPQVHIQKVDNSTWTVSFDAGLPANSTTVLQSYYDGTNVIPGKSSLTVTIK